MARYVRFFGLAVATVCVVGALGYLPTRRLAGDEAHSGDGGRLRHRPRVGGDGRVRCSWRVGAETPNAQMQRAFLAMVVRLAVVVVLGVAATLSGVLHRMPLLFWLATTYVAAAAARSEAGDRDRVNAQD